MQRERLLNLLEKQKEVNAEIAKKMESVEKLMETLVELMETLADNGWPSVDKFIFSQKDFLDKDFDRWLHCVYEKIWQVNISVEENKLIESYKRKIKEVIEEGWKIRDNEYQWLRMNTDIHTWLDLSELGDLIKLKDGPNSFSLFFGKKEEMT